MTKPPVPSAMATGSMESDKEIATTAMCIYFVYPLILAFLALVGNHTFQKIIMERNNHQ